MLAAIIGGIFHVREVQPTVQLQLVAARVMADSGIQLGVTIAAIIGHTVVVPGESDSVGVLAGRLGVSTHELHLSYTPAPSRIGQQHELIVPASHRDRGRRLLGGQDSLEIFGSDDDSHVGLQA